MPRMPSKATSTTGLRSTCTAPSTVRCRWESRLCHLETEVHSSDTTGNTNDRLMECTAPSASCCRRRWPEQRWQATRSPVDANESITFYIVFLNMIFSSDWAVSIGTDLGLLQEVLDRATVEDASAASRAVDDWAKAL